MTITRCKTLCVNCKHHAGCDGDGQWYDHHCHHPDKTRPKEQCPVTGKILFAAKNDLGQIVLVRDEHPYCRDINNGNCPLFEGKVALGDCK